MGYGDIAFTSAFRYERISTKSHKDFSGVYNTPGVITIPHNLGYKPYFKLSYRFGTGKIYPLFAGTSSYNIDGNAMQIDNITVDTTNIYVTISDQAFSGATRSGTIYYRIYEEPQV